MSRFDPSRFGPVLAGLIPTSRSMGLSDELLPGAEQQLPALESLTLGSAFAHTELRDTDHGLCCLAGAWLLYGYLDHSHTISQGVSSPSGSFWHAIMHRREGDYSNAKYWVRRTGDHPAYPLIASRVGGPGWDAAVFVDRCEAAVRGRGDADRCRELQQAEWETLMDYCYDAAVGAL